MSNIVDAILNIVNSQSLPNRSSSNNRANQMGEALENYVKDIFAGTQEETDESKRIQKISQTFCYLGNQNNPPDSMLKNGGDAIEVKKIEQVSSALALNSSYPKSKLYSDSTLINKACRECESWEVRDMLYVVGVVNDGRMSALSLIYGEDYCASRDVYEKIKTKIKEGIITIPDVEFSETKELGRVNRVDPLGITYLRIRGMWHIENPFEVFKEIFKIDSSKEFNFRAIISTEKKNKLTNFCRLVELAENNPNFDISDVKIQEPNNPAHLKDAVLISFSI